MTRFLVVFNKDGVSDQLLHKSADNFHLPGEVSIQKYHGQTIGVCLAESMTAANEEVIENDDRYLVIFDGRLDNRARISNALSCTSGQTSDCKLFLESFRSWGDSCFIRLLGAYIFVIIDKQKGSLIVGRDKTGIRKIFFEISESGVKASNILTPLVYFREEPVQVNYRLLLDFLLFRKDLSRETFYEDISRVERGSTVTIENGESDEKIYWTPNCVKTYPQERRENIGKKYIGRIEKALESRFERNSNYAVPMSGGLDSSTLASFINGEYNQNIKTYSMVFESLGNDEHKEEKRRIRKIKTHSDLDNEEILIDDCWTLKEPSVHDSYLLEGACLQKLEEAHLNLYRSIRNDEYDVLVNGTGADLLKGDRTYYADLLRKGRIFAFADHIYHDPIDTRSLLWYSFLTLFPSIGSTTGGGPTFMYHAYDCPWVNNTFIDRHKSDFDHEQTGDLIESEYESDKLNYRTFFNTFRDFELYLGQLTANRQGLEIWFPYYDPRVVDFVFTLLPSQRFEHGVSKIPLREGAKGYIPEEVRKQNAYVGFNPLMENGFDYEKKTVKSIFLNAELIEHGVTSTSSLQAVIDDYYSGNIPPTAFWRLISTELWLQEVNRFNRNVA